MLGASLYLSEGLEKNVNLIDKMKHAGVTDVFTSLHIPEEDSTHLLETFRKILDEINNRDMDLFVDISSDTLSKFGINKKSMVPFFQELGLKTLRIDYGFDFEEMKTLYHHFQLVLNASVINEEYCDNLERSGIDLTQIKVCHNFYPRENTGLDRKFFIERNQFLKEKGFSIIAFISGDEDKRGPVYQGLPTLEEHRYLSPMLAYLDLTTDCLVDEVMVGDIEIKDSSRERISTFIQEGVLSLHVTVPQDTPLPPNFYEIHRNRKDQARDVVRASQSRIDLMGKTVKPFQTEERPTGSITIDNTLYGRYSGEIQITKRNLPQDPRVNVLGKINEEDLSLLQYIGPGIKFKFINSNQK